MPLEGGSQSRQGLVFTSNLGDKKRTGVATGWWGWFWKDTIMGLSGLSQGTLLKRYHIEQA